MTQPLGADLYVGVPESELGRCADMIPGAPIDLAAAPRPERNLIQA